MKISNFLSFSLILAITPSAQAATESVLDCAPALFRAYSDFGKGYADEKLHPVRVKFQPVDYDKDSFGKAEARAQFTDGYEVVVSATHSSLSFGGAENPLGALDINASLRQKDAQGKVRIVSVQISSFKVSQGKDYAFVGIGGNNMIYLLDPAAQTGVLNAGSQLTGTDAEGEVHEAVMLGLLPEGSVKSVWVQCQAYLYKKAETAAPRSP